DDAVDEQKRIPVRQDLLNRRVIERQREVHPNDRLYFERPASMPESTTSASSTEALTTLFALGREVTSVLDLNELLPKIPQLIARLTKFTAFAVYLLDPKGNELTVAYSIGYPEDTARTLHVTVGRGLVGAAVEEGRPLLVNDVHADPRYVEAVPGSRAELVGPLRRKGR